MFDDDSPTQPMGQRIKGLRWAEGPGSTQTPLRQILDVPSPIKSWNKAFVVNRFCGCTENHGMKIMKYRRLSYKLSLQQKLGLGSSHCESCLRGIEKADMKQQYNTQ